MNGATRLFVFVCLILAAAAPALAGPMYFNFSGTFVQDDNRSDFVFNILSPAVVTLQSWSYAGGTDPLSNIVPGGGFGPVLSLFDSAGNLLAFDNGGTVGGIAPKDCASGGRLQDAVSGLCLDAFEQVALGAAGSYRLVITEQDNIPAGLTLADGFALNGTGNFTGGPFIDAGGNQLTSNFYFTVGLVDDARPAPVPEPAPVLLLASVLALFFCRGPMQMRG